MDHVYLGNLNTDKEIDAGIGICYTLNALMAYRLNTCIVHCRVAAHAAWRDTYTGASLHGFRIWSNDVLLCAKPKAVAVAGNQASRMHEEVYGAKWPASQLLPGATALRLCRSRDGRCVARWRDSRRSKQRGRQE